MSASNALLDSAARLLDYHRLSKLTETSRPVASDLASRPDPHRVFPTDAKIDLPTTVLDVPIPVVPLLQHGLDVVPGSLHSPPQDLKTLATWLHLAAGVRQAQRFDWGSDLLRAVPSADGIYPSEIYVAAFAIDGLAPGLYHFSAREFSLRKLREGIETLALIRRGRPDLNFMTSAPAALLVTSVFCRSGWRHGRRGYRQAVLEAGHLIGNVHAVATGLGMTTMTRLRMNDASMRELIGLLEDFDYAAAEAVQGMVVWADVAARPMVTNGFTPTPALHALARPIQNVVSFGSVLAAHLDTVSGVVGQREIRPPLTDLSPVPEGLKTQSLSASEEQSPGRMLRAVLTDVACTSDFLKAPIGRRDLMQIAGSAFRGGTFLPLRPSGVQSALVKPLWVLNAVSGQESGIWWYDAADDRWAILSSGQYGEIAARLIANRKWLEGAAAVCVMVANLRKVMGVAGPDAYRLAFVEAGVMAQRMHLAATSIDLCACTFGDFYDDAWRQFMGLANTTWELIAITAIGAKTPRKS